ncbi:MAG: ubiquinone biosynthesis protein UbiA [Flaviaesturariibacter sp.]|nr:ubiquinone biosynthesis protein UbiA [Flaviaesturariibacter sp.]
MKLAAAFFRLVRWQNLVFIVMTQALFYVCIDQSLFPDGRPAMLGWLMAASVFIAAGGYIINDYFDLNIDQVNKPSKNVINTIISRRWAILWHLGLSLAGVAATIEAVGLHKWHLVLANTVVVVLLWLYSTSFKRQLLIGNVVISLLTAWTVLILFFVRVPFSAAFGSADALTAKFFRLSFLYGGFAFIISLIREAIKDIEDLEGDRRYGCRTLPIVAGVTATKIYATVWIVVLAAALVLLQLYMLQFGWWWAVVYCSVLVIAPLILLLLRQKNASAPADFSRLSRLAKLIMLTGIFSMIFFRLYFR